MPDLDAILSAGHALALPGLLLVIAWQQFINHRQGSKIMSLLEKFGPALDRIDAAVATKVQPLHDEIAKLSAELGQKDADEDALAARLAETEQRVDAALSPPGETAATAEPQPEQPAP